MFAWDYALFFIDLPVYLKAALPYLIYTVRFMRAGTMAALLITI